MSSPAFKFTSFVRRAFLSVKYPDSLLVGTRQVVEEHSDKVVSVLDILLPRLASGWELQRGDQFQFGSSSDPNANNQIANMNQVKLAKAPVNNLDPGIPGKQVLHSTRPPIFSKLRTITRI